MDDDDEDEDEEDDCKNYILAKVYYINMLLAIVLLPFLFDLMLTLPCSLVAPSPPVVKKRKLGKNPTVDTSFLPDRDREVRSNI